MGLKILQRVNVHSDEVIATKYQMEPNGGHRDTREMQTTRRTYNTYVTIFPFWSKRRHHVQDLHDSRYQIMRLQRLRERAAGAQLKARDGETTTQPYN